jgi:hypothetical protein
MVPWKILALAKTLNYHCDSFRFLEVAPSISILSGPMFSKLYQGNYRQRLSSFNMAAYW